MTKFAGHVGSLCVIAHVVKGRGLPNFVDRTCPAQLPKVYPSLSSPDPDGFCAAKLSK